jgi:DNA gyrase subunit A
LPISGGDRIASIIAVGDTFQPDEYLVLLTKRGFIKKTPVEAFTKLTSRSVVV